MLKKFPRVNLIATGKRIETLMQKNHLVVKDLQEAFGFEYPQAIYKWLKGSCLPTIDNLVILALLFHTTIDKIVVISE